jgi:hypothetical protein
MGIPPSGVDATSPVRVDPRRRRRPSILVAAIVAVAAGLAPAAVAASGEPAPGSSVEFLPPTPEAGVPLIGFQHVKARASALGVVRSLRVAIRSDDPSIPTFESLAGGGPPLPRQATVELDWDTATLTHNGVYRLEAQAETCATTCGTVDTARTGLLVANPPATPGGVRAAFRDRVAVVTWDPGQEADLLGYRVLRSAGDEHTLVGSVEGGRATSFEDTGAPAGLGLSYAVVAVRRSPVAGPPDACRPFAANCATSGRSPWTPLIAIPAVNTPGPGDGTTQVGPGSGTVVVAPPAPPPVVDAAQPAPAPAPPAPAPAAGPTRALSRAADAPARGSAGDDTGSEPLTAEPGPEPGVTAEAPVEVEGLEIARPAPPGGEAGALDRVESASDRTVTVITLVLLALGLLGAYKAKRILRPSR